jgi:hypothetical protein
MHYLRPVKTSKNKLHRVAEVGHRETKVQVAPLVAVEALADNKDLTGIKQTPTDD